MLGKKLVLLKRVCPTRLSPQDAGVPNNGFAPQALARRMRAYLVYSFHWEQRRRLMLCAQNLFDALDNTGMLHGDVVLLADVVG